VLVCLLFSRRCSHLKESPVFKRIPESSNRPGVVAKTVAQKSSRPGDWKWVELIAIFLKARVLEAVVRAQNNLVGAQLRNQSCERIDAPGFGELDNFPEGGLGTLIAMARRTNRLHSAVCQGGDLPQAQQSTVGGHERQAKHFRCSGQKAIRWIRMLKRQFLGCNDDFVCQWSLPHVHRCLCHPISDRTVQVYPTLGM
jgi:hypothetical protein